MESPCFCGEARYRLVLKGNYDRGIDAEYDFSVVECLNCGLARTFPPPDVTQYERGYPPTTAQGRFAGTHTDMWSEPIAAYVAKRAPGKQLLDVGCHVGNLVAAATARGFAAEGIDIDPVATAEGRRLGRRVRTTGIEDIGGAWDVVVLNHVLEHVLDLRGFLACLARVLAPGGRAFVCVPHRRGLLPLLMKGRWMGWIPSQHVWHFTPTTLARIVQQASGLRLVACTTEGVIEPPSRGAKGAVKGWVSELSRRMGWGDQIEAIFEKPVEGEARV